MPGKPIEQESHPSNQPERAVAREWGESLGIALVLALILRHFVVEAFKIPTKSMEPTLVGDTASGDKILVNKFVYDFGKPERGDVIVFKYPEDPFKNYIKRLIGLPGETIRIFGGDIYVDGKIWRKPRPVQRALWMPVSNDNFLWDEIAEDALGGSATILEIEKWQIQHRAERTERVMKRRLNTAWLPAPETAWSSLEEGLRGQQDPTADRPAMVRFHLAKIYDRTLEASGKLRPSSLDFVGSSCEVDDLCIRFRVAPERGGGEILAVLADRRHVFRVHLPAGDRRRVRVHVQNKFRKRNEPEEEFIDGPELALPVGETSRIAWMNVDDTLTLEVDRQPFFRHPYESDPGTSSAAAIRTETGLGVFRTSAAFTHIAVERDIYYRSQISGLTSPNATWTLREREYFVLGDNSPNSKDSRLWSTGPAVPEENLIGEAFMVFWPPKRIRIIR